MILRYFTRMIHGTGSQSVDIDLGKEAPSPDETANISLGGFSYVPHEKFVRERDKRMKLEKEMRIILSIVKEYDE